MKKNNIKKYEVKFELLPKDGRRIYPHCDIPEEKYNTCLNKGDIESIIKNTHGDRFSGIFPVEDSSLKYNYRAEWIENNKIKGEYPSEIYFPGGTVLTYPELKERVNPLKEFVQDQRKKGNLGGHQYHCQNPSPFRYNLEEEGNGNETSLEVIDHSLHILENVIKSIENDGMEEEKIICYKCTNGTAYRKSDIIYRFNPKTDIVYDL